MPHLQDSTNEPQRFRTRCWLARRFPINVQTLIPLLECIGGSANKSLAEAAAFLRSFPGLEERFPVRIQVRAMAAAATLPCRLPCCCCATLSTPGAVPARLLHPGASALVDNLSSAVI